MAPNPGKTVSDDPQQIIFWPKKNSVGDVFFEFGLFRTSTAPERSEKGLGRSETIREHSEMTWNA